MNRIEMFYYPKNTKITLNDALKEIGECNGIKVREYNNGTAIFVEYPINEEE